MPVNKTSYRGGGTDKAALDPSCAGCRPTPRLQLTSQLKPETLIHIKCSLEVRAYIYCTKKQKPSKMSSGMVRVSAAKGSVYVVNAGPSTPSHQSPCYLVQNTKKGAPLAGQDRQGLLCLTLLVARPWAGPPGTAAHEGHRPLPNCLPEQQAQGSSPEESQGISGPGEPSRR